MSGTELAYGAPWYWASRCAVPGSIRRNNTPGVLWNWYKLLSPYAVSGTDIAYVIPCAELA
eukprot:2855663-Rhodomonas_salina.1